MRIGLFSWESMHSVTVGGVSPHVSSLAEGLAKMGHEVHVFTRSGWMRSYDKIDGVHYQRVSFDYAGDIIREMNAMCNAMADRFYAVERLFGKFDVLHVHDWHPVRALLNVKTHRGTPFVMTFHSTEYGRGGNQTASSIVGKEIAHIEWMAGFESSGLITVSEHMRHELKKVYEIPMEKVTAIPNGVTEVEVLNDLDSIKSKFRYNLHKGRDMVLFLGRIAWQKGPDILLRAAELAKRNGKRADYVFAGWGDMLESCKILARELGIADDCRFLGYVSDEEKTEVYNICDIYAMPSRNEPFGITALEAWSVEKPVMATKAVGYIDHGLDGYRSEIDHRDFAVYLEKMLGDKQMGQKMGKVGKKRINAEFDWGGICEKTVEVYRKCLR